MNRKGMLVTVFMVSSLSLSAATDNKLATDDCTQTALLSELTTGVVTGAASSAVVSYLRTNVLPDLDSLKLHDNYGICRDQLEGKAKVGVALLGAQAVNPSVGASLTKLTARLVGVMAGITLVEVINKNLL